MASGERTGSLFLVGDTAHCLKNPLRWIDVARVGKEWEGIVGIITVKQGVGFR